MQVRFNTVETNRQSFELSLRYIKENDAVGLKKQLQTRAITLSERIFGVTDIDLSNTMSVDGDQSLRLREALMKNLELHGSKSLLANVSMTFPRPSDENTKTSFYYKDLLDLNEINLNAIKKKSTDIGLEYYINQIKDFIKFLSNTKSPWMPLVYGLGSFALLITAIFAAPVLFPVLIGVGAFVVNSHLDRVSALNTEFKQICQNDKADFESRVTKFASNESKSQEPKVTPLPFVMPVPSYSDSVAAYGSPLQTTQPAGIYPNLGASTFMQPVYSPVNTNK